MVSATALINHCRALSASEVGLNIPPHHAAPVPAQGHWSRLVAPTGTKGLVLELAWCGGMFSPTSLAERLRQWFISAAALTTSSSSQMQAYGPIMSLFACGAYWAFCGSESWPMDGFLVVFRPWWPSRWHNFFLCFLFSLLLYLFCFVSTYNKKLIYFISNYLCILL